MKHTLAKTTRSLSFALSVICILTAASGCRGALRSKPPVHLQQNMDNVRYIESQEPSDFFADGRGMRPPVPGTIAVGALREDSVLYEGVDAGQYVTTLPGDLTLDDAFLERGQERYDIYCTPCHGPAGRGNGIVGRRAATYGSLIPTFHDELRRSYPVGRIYSVIAHGYNNMPSYAAQIKVEDRWAIASYVRVLQINQGATEEQFAASENSQGDQE